MKYDSIGSGGGKDAIKVRSIGFQFFIAREANIHSRISNSLYSKYEKSMVFYDQSKTTNILRYVNPFYGAFACKNA